MSRAFVAICAILAACVAACWPSFQVLLSYWSDTRAMGMTHGWLIAAMVLWLLWRERKIGEKGIVPSVACWACLAAAVVLWFAWLVALRAGLQIVHLALLPVIAWLAVASTLGRPLARQFAYPLGYFYFAIPIWGNLTPPLQWTTIYAVRFMLRATGVPAYFQGDTVHVPGGHFSIVGGCSGLHYFLVSLAVASLYSHMHRDPPRRHITIVAIAGVSAILLNWIRVYCVIVSGYLTDMQGFLVRVDHYWFGWVLFGIAMMISLWIASRVLPATEPADASVANVQPGVDFRWPAVAATVGLLVMLGVWQARMGTVSASGTVHAVTAPELSAVLVRAGLVLQTGTSTDAEPVPSTTGTGTEAVPVPTVPVSDDAIWQPRFFGARSEFRGSTADGAVGVYVGVYATQRQGAELAYYRNSVIGRHLEELSSGRRDGIAWTMAEDKQENRWLVWSVYLVGGRTFANPTVAQAFYALRSIGGAVPSAVVSVAIRCNSGCADREAAMSAALNQVLAPVSDVLSSRAH